MKRLDDKIYMKENKNERGNSLITITQTNENTFYVESPKLDTRWYGYDTKTLNKIHKGLIAVEKAKCIVKGSLNDALLLAYTLRAVL